MKERKTGEKVRNRVSVCVYVCVCLCVCESAKEGGGGGENKECQLWRSGLGTEIAIFIRPFGSTWRGGRERRLADIKVCLN